jgi:inhibitor of KinA sporulation pathway (predicted exonuclease)
MYVEKWEFPKVRDHYCKDFNAISFTKIDYAKSYE